MSVDIPRDRPVERRPAGSGLAATGMVVAHRAPGLAAREKMYRHGRVERQPVCDGSGGVFR